MSGLADEVQRRIDADQGAGLTQPPAGEVPGTGGGTQPAPSPPAAEPSTTDTGEGPPDSIPYARFKEVNDRYQALKGFERLTGYGYDSDSLSRLAAFEASYQQDPVGTWRAMAADLDLPKEVLDAMESHLGGTPPTEPSPPAQGTTEPPPSTPQADLPPEDRARLDYVDQLRAREQETASAAQLDRVMGHWTAMDERDQIETPENIKLQAIMAVAQSGQRFENEQALVEAARRQIIEYRSSVLGNAVQRTGRSGPPLPVPGSSPPAGAGPVKFKDIREATRAAEADLKAGRLPQL